MLRSKQMSLELETLEISGLSKTEDKSNLSWEAAHTADSD